MLTNTYNAELGFTATLRNRDAVVKQSRRLARKHGRPVVVWRDEDGYTGFTVEGTLAEAYIEAAVLEAEIVTVVEAK